LCFIKETVGQSVTALSNDDQKTRQKSSPRRGSTQSLNIVFPKETNEQERFSGDDFENPNRGMYQSLKFSSAHILCFVVNRLFPKRCSLYFPVVIYKTFA
jgi:hypothetical protein